MKYPVLKIVLALGILSLITMLTYFVILKNGDFHHLEELYTLTGRIPFWKALITEGFTKEPLLGYGFMRINYYDTFQSINTYAGKMTHNTFLQVLMNLGLMGFLLVLFQLITTLHSISKLLTEYRLLFFALLVPLLINSLTEFGIFGESNYAILFYQFIIFYSSSFHKGYLTTAQTIRIKRHKLISHE